MVYCETASIKREEKINLNTTEPGLGLMKQAQAHVCGSREGKKKESKIVYAPGQLSKLAASGAP